MRRWLLTRRRLTSKRESRREQDGVRRLVNPIHDLLPSSKLGVESYSDSPLLPRSTRVVKGATPVKVASHSHGSRCRIRQELVFILNLESHGGLKDASR